MIKKKFIPLQSPNERGLSSVGLERLLDRQEVGSSNLPVLTTRKRHLQRCRCLFFYSDQSPRFRLTAAQESPLYVSTTVIAVRRGPKSTCGAPQTPAQRTERISWCGYLAAGTARARVREGLVPGESAALPPDFHADAVRAVGEAEEEGAGGGVPGADGAA